MGKRLAKMEICNNTRGKQRFWWRLVGGNGEIICTSEKFPTKAHALRAINRTIEIIKGDWIKDEIRA